MSWISNGRLQLSTCERFGHCTLINRQAGPSGRGERRMWLRHGVRGAQGAEVGKPAAGPSSSFTMMMTGAV